MLREGLQQIELQRRHRDIAALIVRQSVSGEVEHTATDANAFGADIRAMRGGSTAEHALDARQHFARVERLRHVIVGAHLETDDAIDDRRGGSQHDDRDRRVALAKMPRETQAVLARHMNVDERQIHWVLCDQRLRRNRVFCADGGVAMRDEVLLEHLANVRLVVDDEDRAFRNHGDRCAPSRALVGTRHRAGREENSRSYNCGATPATIIGFGMAKPLVRG